MGLYRQRAWLTSDRHVTSFVWQLEFWCFTRDFTAVGTRRIVAQVIQMDGAELFIAHVIRADVNSFHMKNHALLLHWHQRRISAKRIRSLNILMHNASSWDKNTIATVKMGVITNDTTSLNHSPDCGAWNCVWWIFQNYSTRTFFLSFSLMTSFANILSWYFCRQWYSSCNATLQLESMEIAAQQDKQPRLSKLTYRIPSRFCTISLSWAFVCQCCRYTITWPHLLHQQKVAQLCWWCGGFVCWANLWQWWRVYRIRD
jgi:hypothetical protein